MFVWLTRGRRKAASYEPFVKGKRMVLSFVSVAELWRGAAVMEYNAASRQRLEAAIGRTLVVSADNELTHEWAKVTADARAWDTHSEQRHSSTTPGSPLRRGFIHSTCSPMTDISMASPASR